ncbi:MAG: DUF488 domain-containing protein [Candidatus Hydrogenedentes bacterium]|nr:DUF488 domain-containing protein [Candidatus Hydrogenedentota bacterium]
MKLFTIGFTKKSARDFFSRLKHSGATRLVDIRLNNVSQLAGFAKRDDLEFFAEAICGITYHHVPELAPTQEIRDAYTKNNASWEQYEQDFLDLMASRQIERMDKSLFDGACLLCSEDKPEHCHRRLVAEYLKTKWGNIDIVHL